MSAREFLLAPRPVKQFITHHHTALRAGVIFDALQKSLPGIDLDSGDESIDRFVPRRGNVFESGLSTGQTRRCALECMTEELHANVFSPINRFIFLLRRDGSAATWQQHAYHDLEDCFFLANKKPDRNHGSGFSKGIGILNAGGNQALCLRMRDRDQGLKF